MRRSVFAALFFASVVTTSGCQTPPNAGSSGPSATSYSAEEEDARRTAAAYMVDAEKLAPTEFHVGKPERTKAGGWWVPVELTYDTPAVLGPATVYIGKDGAVTDFAGAR